MRWDLVDKFTELKKGERARATKCFTGQEDFFAEHHPGRPTVPQPLFVEMIAQAGGVLFGLHLGFQKEVILAKITSARFPEEVRPPCELEIEALIDEREDAAMVSGTVRWNGRVAAEAEILLAAVPALDGGAEAKIVFNDGFLAHYDILNVARASGSAA